MHCSNIEFEGSSLLQESTELTDSLHNSAEGRGFNGMLIGKLEAAGSLDFSGFDPAAMVCVKRFPSSSDSIESELNESSKSCFCCAISSGGFFDVLGTSSLRKVGSTLAVGLEMTIKN